MKIHHNLAKPNIILRWFDVGESSLVQVNEDAGLILTFFVRKYNRWDKKWEYDLSVKTTCESQVKHITKKSAGS